MSIEADACAQDGLRPGFASRPKTRGQVAIDGRDIEQIGYCDVQDLGHRIYAVDGDVLATTFDPADIGSINLRLEGKTLLAETTRYPQTTNVEAEKSTRVHCCHRTNLRLDNRRTDNPL